MPARLKISPLWVQRLATWLAVVGGLGGVAIGGPPVGMPANRPGHVVASLDDDETVRRTLRDDTTERVALQIFDLELDPAPAPIEAHFADEPSKNAVATGLSDRPAPPRPAVDAKFIDEPSADAYSARFPIMPPAPKRLAPPPLVHQVNRQQDPVRPKSPTKHVLRPSLVRLVPVDTVRSAKPANAEPPAVAATPGRGPTILALDPAAPISRPETASAVRPGSTPVRATFSDADREAGIPELLTHRKSPDIQRIDAVGQADPLASILKHVFAADSAPSTPEKASISDLRPPKEPQPPAKPLVQLAAEPVNEPRSSPFVRVGTGRLVRRTDLPLLPQFEYQRPSTPPLQGVQLATFVQEARALAPEDEAALRTLADMDADFKPINSVAAVLRPGLGELPADFAAPRFAKARSELHVAGTSRAWAISGTSWEATAMYHNPLYFQEINSERHGYTTGPAQPFLSAAHFFVRVPALPYFMAADCPWDKTYTLGHYRPGNAVPHHLNFPPLKPSAGLVEAGMWTGMIFLIP